MAATAMAVEDAAPALLLPRGLSAGGASAWGRDGNPNGNSSGQVWVMGKNAPNLRCAYMAAWTSNIEEEEKKESEHHKTKPHQLVSVNTEEWVVWVFLGQKGLCVTAAVPCVYLVNGQRQGQLKLRRGDGRRTVQGGARRRKHGLVPGARQLGLDARQCRRCCRWVGRRP